MGVELDSLSDDISFGIAAGALMYAYQLHELGPLGFIPVPFWVPSALSAWPGSM